MDQPLHSPDEMAGYVGFLMHRRRVESSDSLLQHFGFQEDPFRVSPDPRYMYPSRTHLEALASLENGFYNNRGFIAMIAPPGMGKTTLLYRFLEDTRETARSVFLFDIDPDCKPRDFVGYILREFGVTPAQTSSEMHNQLGEALINETNSGRKCVVVIDEAQNLSNAVLERVRLITNFETTEGKLLQIILSGQPQLTDKLLQDSLVQLRQRVSTFCHLDLLTPEETVEYIDFRLRQAGYTGDALFTEDALKLIAETSKGTPRSINNLCYNSLALCCTMQCNQVDSEMVAKVVASMRLDPRSSESESAKSQAANERPSVLKLWQQFRQMLTQWGQTVDSKVPLWVVAAAAVLLLSVLGVLRLNGVGATQPRNSSDERPMDLKVSPESVRAPAAPKTGATNSAKSSLNTKSIQPGYPAVHREAVPPSNVAQVSALQQAGAEEQTNSNAAGANPETPKLNPAPTRQSGAPSASSTTAPASLNIDSSPAGADIEIDGAFVGNTPSTVSVGRGSHQITLKRKGFMEWSKALSVTGGAIHLNAELEHESPSQ
jgi:general secretion pathway protein A